MRCRLEGELCFCDSSTKEVDGNSLVVFNDGELLATILDIRTVHCKHLTNNHHTRAKNIYVKAYTKYYRRAEVFHKEAKDRKAVKEAEAVVMSAASVLAKATPASQVENELVQPVEPITISTEDNLWSDEERGAPPG